LAQRNFKERSDDELFGDWLGWINRAKDEAVSQAWRYKMFRLLRGIYEQNPELQQKGGFFVEWAVDNYVAAAAMAFRRELDTQPGTENLFHLLCEMRDRPSVISRARFRKTWGAELEHFTADKAFDTFPILQAANRDEDHIDPASVVADLATLAQQDDVLMYVQTTVAHRIPNSRNPTVPTFGDFHAAVQVVSDLLARYYVLLTHSEMTTFEPVAQYDEFEAFTKAWISDPKSFDFSKCR
jgi:hypothetical protein